MNENTRPGSVSQLPPHIQTVWHGVNDRTNLRRFLASPIEWAELDVNLSADGTRLILRHDTYAELPPWEGESELLLADALTQLTAHGRSIKIDFKVGGLWIDKILAILEPFDIAHDKLWFNGDLALLDSRWIAELSTCYPGAVIQLPLSSVIAPGLSQAEILRALDALAATGVTRWSVGWHYPDRDRLIETLQGQGYQVNLYGVDDLNEFLDALALHPTSVTADFNFPTWNLHGRGSGHRGRFHTF